MAILDFLNKDTGEETPVEESFTPKTTPARGPGGKFVSKKKPIEPNEDVSPKEEGSHEEAKPQGKKVKPQGKTAQIATHATKGPYPVSFGNGDVRRFYTNKWYFATEDLLALLNVNPALEPLDILKTNKKVAKVFEDNIKNVDGIDCSDASGSAEILKEVINVFHAEFPGSLFRSIEDISKLPFNITDPSDTPVQAAPQGNPSDRG